MMNIARTAPLALALLVLALLSACTTPSISGIGTRFSAEYAGELHPVEVLSTLDLDPAGTRASLVPGQRVLLVQSGAERPDPLLIEAFGAAFEIETTSGVPLGVEPPYWRQSAAGVDTEPGRRLQRTARSLGVDTILIVFGRFDMRQTPTVGAIIGWIPIVGYPIPMLRTTAGIRGTLLLIDVESGHSAQYLPEDRLAQGHVTSSLMSEEADLMELADRVKAGAYSAWARATQLEFAP